MKNLVVIFFLLAFFQVFSQNETNIEELQQKEKRHYLGANLGTLNGLGVSYKYQVGKIGLQVAALPPVGEKYATSYGASIHYRIHSKEITHFSVNTGFHSNTLYGEENTTAGIGFGIETGREKVKVLVSINYQLYDIGDNDLPFLGLDYGVFYNF